MRIRSRKTARWPRLDPGRFILGGVMAAAIVACGGAPAGPVTGGAPVAGGSMLVVSDRGGAWRIYEIAAVGAARLVGSPGASDTAYQDGMPARLADNRIVFVSDRDGAPELYLVEPGARAASRLFEAATGSGEAYSDAAPAPLGPDRIVFARRKRDDPPGAPRDLYSARLDGTDLRRLTRHPADDGAPSGAPDGRAVVFVSNRAGAPHLFLLPDTGSADPEARIIDLSIAAPPGNLPAGAPGAGKTPPAMADANAYADSAPILLADGSILFSRSQGGRPPQLYVMGRAGRRMALRQITDPLTLRYGAEEPVPLGDGTVLFVTGPASGAGLHAVYQMALGGFNQKRLSRDNAPYSDFTRRLR